MTNKDLPHSKTVRGTLSNPKTKEAKSSSKPTPTLGDHGSLSAESSSSSAPKQDSGTVEDKQEYKKKPLEGESSIGSPSSGPPSEDDSSNLASSEMDGEKEGGLEHSKKVRGTMDNAKTKQALISGAKPKQLGDPSSMVREGKEGKSKL